MCPTRRIHQFKSDDFPIIREKSFFVVSPRTCRCNRGKSRDRFVKVLRRFSTFSSPVSDWSVDYRNKRHTGGSLIFTRNTRPRVKERGKGGHWRDAGNGQTIKLSRQHDSARNVKSSRSVVLNEASRKVGCYCLFRVSSSFISTLVRSLSTYPRARVF